MPIIMNAINTYINNFSFTDRAYLGPMLIIAAICRLILFIVRRKLLTKNFSAVGLPYQKGHLLFGVFSSYTGKVIHEEWERASKEIGLVCTYCLGDTKCVLISDPEVTKQVYVDQQAKLIHRAKLPMEPYPICESILFLGGHRWRRQRRLVQPIFSRHRLEEKEMASHLYDTVDKMMNYLDNKSEETRKNGQTSFDVAIYQLMKSTTYHLIGNMALNMKSLKISENEPIIHKLDHYLETIGDHEGPVKWVLAFPVVRYLLEFILKYVTAGPFMAHLFKGVNQRIDELKRSDLASEDKSNRVPFLDSLIKLHKEGDLSRSEVQGNALAILVAGYDTTSTTLAYVFWHIAKYSDIQEKLHSEILREGSSSEYLEAIIYETSRLFTALPVFATRYIKEPMTITTQGKTVTIPGDVMLFHNMNTINRDPNYWPEADKFIPERFIQPDGKLLKKMPEFFGPFGFGLRKCPGQALAIMEMKMIVASILSKYRLELISPEKLVMVTHALFLSKPKEEVKLRFWPRK